VGPDYNRPGYQAPAVYKEAGASTALVPPPNPAGGGWQAANPSDGMLRGKWWEIYQDPQLNQLEERIAATTKAFARLLRHIWPRATRSLQPEPVCSNAQRRHRRKPRPHLRKSSFGKPHDQLQRPRDWWPGKLGARLLGRVRRTVEAARETAQADAAIRQHRFSLHAEMASDYFQLRGLDAQAKTANGNPQ